MIYTQAANLAKPDIPGDAPAYPKVHDNALAWLEQIERHELRDWIALGQDAAFSMAPTCLDPEATIPHKARIIGLLAAQIHPDAVAWLRLLSQKCEPALRPLAQVAWQQAVARAQALGLCLSFKQPRDADKALTPKVECS